MSSRKLDDLFAGTATSTTTAATFAGAPGAGEEIIMQPDPDNANDVFIGNATTQPVQLKPGQVFSMSLNNLAVLYHKTASGSALINWIVRG